MRARQGPRARKSEREPGTLIASGWFDNRSQTIAPDDLAVQAWNAILRSFRIRS